MNIRKLTIVGLLLLAVLIGCQPAQLETVEVPVEVTRIVEMPVEVTRIVEVPVEAAAPESASVVPGLDTHTIAFHSDVTGRDYMVYVSLPLTYGSRGEAYEYPALYVTDGDFYTIPTAMAAAIAAFGQEMPEVITVGIGYGGSAWNSLERREEDMTPEAAASFLQFLQEELIPEIETSYQVDPALRTLMGHSLGGDFSLYSLFNASETFDQIIASSPGGELAQEYASAFAADPTELPARLFVSVGELDPLVSGVEAFCQTLEAAEYDGLEMEMMVLDGESHLSASPRAFMTGLRWAFAGGGGED